MSAQLDCGSSDADSMMIGQHKRPLDQSVDQPAKYLKPSSDDAKLHGDGAVEPGKQPRGQPQVNDAVLDNGQGPCWRSVLEAGHEAGGSSGVSAGACEAGQEQPLHGHGGPNGACTIPPCSAGVAACTSQHLDEGKIVSLREDGAAVVIFDPVLTPAGDSSDLVTPSSSAHPCLAASAGRDGPAEDGQRMCLVKDGIAQGGEQAGGSGLPEANHRNQRNRGNVEDPVVFLETVEKVLEARKTKRTRPLPVMMAGKVLNLYTLNSKVRELGGYCKVTTDALWGNVARELGLAQLCGPGVKLVYFKYLRKLESRKSLGAAAAVSRLNGEPTKAVASQSSFPGRQVSDGKGEKHRAGVGVEQSGDSESSREEADELRGQGDSGGNVGLCMQNEQLLEGRDDKEAWLPDVHDGNSSRLGSGSSRRADDFGVGAVEQTEQDVSEGRAGLDQSKTESLAQMLNWIRRLAVNPRDPSRGQATGLGHDGEWVQECHSQAEKIRAFLWRKKDELRSKTPAAAAAADSFHGQNKQPRAHYYEEPADPQGLDRLRSTRERSLHYGFPTSPGVHRPVQGGATPRGSGFLAQVHSGSRQPSSPLPVSFSETAHTNYNFSIGDRGARKRIPLGPDFQAIVPDWNPPGASAAEIPRSGLQGTCLVNDSEYGEELELNVQLWMGRQVWPLLDCKKVVNKDRLGKGRSDICLCEDMESIECVRLHIDEERHRLKEETGSAFTAWKFDEMGEIVADQWTKEEQHVYKTLVKLNPVSLEKNFWDQLPLAFPTRSMKELVSYYFNVFVLRRRAIQNRLHGEKIDSDDDETELPVTDSESSDEYDTGDEGGDDADDGIAEETEKPHLEDVVTRERQFTELEASFNYSSSKLEAECSEGAHDVAVMDLAVSTDLRLHDQSLQLAHHIHLQDPATLGAGWESDLQGDEKNHLEDMTGIGDDALQEVQRWEDPHWDETDHDLSICKHLSISKSDQEQPNDAGEQNGAVPVILGNSQLSESLESAGTASGGTFTSHART